MLTLSNENKDKTVKLARLNAASLFPAGLMSYICIPTMKKCSRRCQNIIISVFYRRFKGGGDQEQKLILCIKIKPLIPNRSYRPE